VKGPQAATNKPQSSGPGVDTYTQNPNPLPHRNPNLTLLLPTNVWPSVVRVWFYEPLTLTRNADPTLIPHRGLGHA